MNSYNKDLNWRYATKKFDATKIVSIDKIENLKTSIQLTASSYGLQPYEVLVIENKEIKEKLKPAAWNQSQITDASHLFVFASYIQLDENYLDTYLSNISKTRSVPKEQLSGFLEMLRNTVLKLDAKEQQIWAAKQAYIALGNFLSAAAHIEIDTCPMEGFDANAFDTILGLKNKGLTTTVIAPVGYRSEDDPNQFAPKVRKSKNQLFHLI